MKTKWLAIIFAAFFSVVLVGCSSSAGTEETGSKKTVTGPNIAGIQLGDSRDHVVQVLGDDYSETVNSEPAYYGEPQRIMKYDRGITVIIGKESLRVLHVLSHSPEFQNDLGVKVGDPAGVVLQKYRPKYEEYQGVNSDGKNLGWFEVADGILMIFDYLISIKTITQK
ncbi:MAG: hypothetical protein HPY58_05485 [Firmicutes bacterium]|nr:hypothetical protein [Bacillota bacterium]